MIDMIKKSLVHLKKEKPVILNLTNFVTMEFVANCQLAIGASPIMSCCHEELEELIDLCSCIYINIGTLNHEFIDLVKKSLFISKQKNKPIVFDPVGAGCTRIRTQISKEIAPYASIIRGNASEIMALGNSIQKTKGTDAVHSVCDVKDISVYLAKQYQATIITSGPIDFLTDGSRQLELPYGSQLMTLVTGMGCALTSVISAFHGILEDSFQAGVIGTSYFGICGQLAEKQCDHQGIGTYKNRFIDQLNDCQFNLEI